MTDTPAQKQRTEDEVEDGAQRVAESVEPSVQKAADSVATAETVVTEAVNTEAESVAKETGLPEGELRRIYQERVDHFLRSQHVAHGGENPPPVVAEAVGGAAAAAAGHAAKEVVPTPPDTPAPVGAAEGKPPARKRDTPPSSGHLKDRRLWGRGK